MGGNAVRKLGAMPSLPHIDAVLGQGPDDVGIVQAFVQYAGEYVDHMPVIEGGGGTDFVRWWAAENKKNGYQTVSMNTTPGISGAAFWLGVALLNGEKAPKKMIMPVATVDADNLDEYGALPAGQIISPTYSPPASPAGWPAPTNPATSTSRCATPSPWRCRTTRAAW